MTYFWIALMCILFIAESVSMQLVCICFAGGALAATFAAMFELNELAQTGIFVGVSAVLLILTRPLVKKITKGRKDNKTNMERIIGEKVIITEEVDNIKGSGKTVLNGVEWKVKSSSGEVIEEGKIVTIEKIEGVKLIVS